MGLIRKQLLKQLLKWSLRKNWSPEVICYTNSAGWFGFEVSMISTAELHFIIALLHNDDRVWWNINMFVNKATDEISSMIGYEFSEAAKKYVDRTCETKHCVDENIMMAASKVAETESHTLLNRIAEYEDKYDMNIRDWFIDYIMIHGREFI